jgi:hypothetical protein
MINFREQCVKSSPLVTAFYKAIEEGSDKAFLCQPGLWWGSAVLQHGWPRWASLYRRNRVFAGWADDQPASQHTQPPASQHTQQWASPPALAPVGQTVPVLADITKVLVEQLGISGTISFVVSEACRQLMVDPEGRSLQQQAEACYHVMMGTPTAPVTSPAPLQLQGATAPSPMQPPSLTAVAAVAPPAAAPRPASPPPAVTAACKSCRQRPPAPGRTARGNPFDTCCRTCATTRGRGGHCPMCIAA